MWCHLPTSIGRLRSLRFIVVALMVVAFLTTLVFATVSHAAPGTSKTISFQGRLMTAAGAVVPDGNYNMQFKIYQGGTGTAAGNPGGTLNWTETYINNGGTSGVDVKNGFFSVELGSVTPFGTSVDWNQDTLFLSMNVAGNASACTTFGSAPCAADGEMLPMKRITATPYSINSGAVGGKTVDNLVQLGQGIQTDAGTSSSIAINKTGSGNLVQLQAGGTDAFTVNNAGSVTMGSSANQSLAVATSSSGGGKSLTVSAGSAASSSNLSGGDLVFQGGTGDGTGTSGHVIVKSNGSDTSGTFQVQNTAGAAVFTVNAATKTVSTGTLDLASGVGDQISSSTNLTISSSGAMTVGPTSQALSLQGSSINIVANSGGNVTMQGGNATVGNGNGGSILLSGGAGNGTGASGLVVLGTPTFSTTTNDANCYTSGAVVASSCTIAQATVDNSSAALIGFSAIGQTATLPDPTIKTAGRIIYVMAAGGSKDFTLATSGGTPINLRQNTTVSMLWNGTLWTTASGSGTTTLQSAYDNTPQSAAGTELTLNNNTNTGGLTIRDSATNPINGTLLEVKNAAANNLLSVNSTDSTTYQTDGTVSNAASFATNWPAVGSATTSRITTDGQEGGDSAQVVAGVTAGNGIENKLARNPVISTQYHISVYAKLVSGSALTDFAIRYSPDGGTTFVDCTNYDSQVITTSWTRVTCLMNTPATTVTTPYIAFIQPTTATTARTFLIDNFSLTQGLSTPQSVQVGSGTGSDQTTLFTVDKAAAAPTASDSNALLGSMYYDTTLGKLQCYEAAGWGACGSSPDVFVSLSPTYSNAVTHGTGTGTLSTDLCSSSLHINDGTSSQPTICGTNETYNFYKWTSAQTTAQTNDMYVTYQLPSTFKKFVAGSASLMGRTDSTDGAVTYQIYRNNQTTGLTACGSSVPTSTGVQSTWQTAVATGTADPSTCSFTGGDSIVFKITFSSLNNANAYISNLNFIYSNH